MNYRKFGKLDYEASILGFGCMRFPTISETQPDGTSKDKINEAEAIEMVRYAIDNGVNYIDTAYPYHQGESEFVVGKALKDGYREKVKLATKLPVWLIKEEADFMKYLDEQLQKLDTDHIDFYLLHALNEERFTSIMKLNVLDFLTRAIAEGKIRHGGFSFHGEIDYFKTIIDAYDWGMCQVQYNYMEDKSWEQNLKYAEEKGIAVVVMEPLLGGKLANNTPEDIMAVWNEAEVKRTPAEWALRWVYNHTAVKVVLSGMGAMAQVEENIKTSGNALPNSLTDKELALIERVRVMYNEKIKVPCTECRYCLPCPQNVAIPGVFYYYNSLYTYNTTEESKRVYARIQNDKRDASGCIECGKCEAACPQKISIIKHLKEAHKALV